MPEQYRITAIKCILPDRIRENLDDRDDSLKTYEDVEAAVLR